MAIDYKEMLKLLFPRGPIWSKLLSGKHINSLLDVISEEFEHFENFHSDVEDAFLLRNKNYDLLSKWENFVGPLSPCVISPSDKLERLKLVVAKFRARGDQRISYYLSLISALGFEATEVKHVPFQMGRQMGNRLRSSDDWFYTVIFSLNNNATNETNVTREVNNNLKCVLDYYMAAHLKVVFQV